MAYTTGWAQRRVRNTLGGDVQATVNGILGTSIDPTVFTTAASAQTFEVTAGNSVSIRWGGRMLGTTWNMSTANRAIWTLDVVYETNTQGTNRWETTSTDTVTVNGSASGDWISDRTLTLTPTHTGTLRIFVRARVEVIATSSTLSDINSDAGTSFGQPAETLPATQTSHDVTYGLMRCGCALSSLGVAGNSTPASYSNALVLTFTTAAAPRLAISGETYTLSWRNAVPTQFTSDTIGTGTSTALVVNRTVDNVFPAASTAVDLLLTPASSALSTANSGTALPWIHFTSLPSTPGTVTGTTDTAGNFVTARFAGAFTADPRFTKVGLLQVNDNTWGTAPLTKDVAMHQRLTADLGFVAMRYRNAAGTGINSLSVNHTLQDSAALTTAVTWSDTTAAEGGEAGWTNTLQPWSSSLPGGIWKHTTTVTAPSAATGLETGYDTLTLLARNPNYQVVAGLTLSSSSAEGDHAHPGDNLIASLCVLNVATDTKVQIDTGSALVSLIRYNSTAQVLEALNTDQTTWSTWSTGTLPTIALTVNPNDDHLYQHTFSSTSGWGSTDILAAQVQCLINGTPYGVDVPREVISAAANSHTRYVPDGAGFVGFPSK